LSYGDVAYVLRVAPCRREAARLLTERLECLTVEAKPRHWQPSTRLRSRLMASVLRGAAVDVDTRELLATWASWQRDIMHAQSFLRRVLEACTNKPTFRVDRGPWYPEALRALGLKWKRRVFVRGTASSPVRNQEGKDEALLQQPPGQEEAHTQGQALHEAPRSMVQLHKDTQTLKLQRHL